MIEAVKGAHIKVSVTERPFLQHMLTNVEFLARYFASSQWHVLMAPENSGFIISDYPLVVVPSPDRQRAVFTFFRAVVPPPGDGKVGLAASLGALITFNLSSDYQVVSKAVQVSAQTPAANATFSEELSNIGAEPVVPRGVIVILNTSGRRVAKATFSPQRLLPGERLVFTATNPGQLRPGHYRTLSSFEFERMVLTSGGEFTIPE